MLPSLLAAAFLMMSFHSRYSVARGCIGRIILENLPRADTLSRAPPLPMLVPTEEPYEINVAVEGG
jgi:hypothetical protein